MFRNLFLCNGRWNSVRFTCSKMRVPRSVCGSQSLIEVDETAHVTEYYRLVILGASEVGKSSLVARYTKGKDLRHKEATLVANYSNIYPEKTTRLDTWEVGGQERWRPLAHLYYKDAEAALILYDVLDETTLRIAKEWIKEIQAKVSANVVIALVANKTDLWDDATINTIDVQNFAYEHGFIFMEISVETGHNINELFAEITRELRKRPIIHKQHIIHKREETKCGCNCIIQ